MFNKGLFEAVMGGRKSKLQVLKSLAAGDPYCEVVWKLMD